MLEKMKTHVNYYMSLSTWKTFSYYGCEKGRNKWVLVCFPSNQTEVKNGAHVGEILHVCLW